MSDQLETLMNPTLSPHVTDEQTRERLLAAIAELAPAIEAAVPFAETNGRLDPAVVDALAERGLWRMRLAEELGGLDASISTQFEVIRALARVDLPTAWCTGVANNALGLIGAHMPDEAIEEIFANGVPRCAVVAGPTGTAVEVEGGYRVTGVYRFSSSSLHAAWIQCTSFLDGDPQQPVHFVVPAGEANIHDNWRVFGLRGTGSCDFSLDDHFVAAKMTVRGDRAVLRGSRDYGCEEYDHIETYEHAAFALGLAERALDEARAALAKRRGLVVAADREVVQTELAELTLRVEAFAATARAFYAQADRVLLGEPVAVSASDKFKSAALAVWVTDLAVECAEFAFRRTGGPAIYTPNRVEKLVRDAQSARLHVLVNDQGMARYGRDLIAEA